MLRSNSRVIGIASLKEEKVLAVMLATKKKASHTVETAEAEAE